jgi:hypothetical protein
LNGEVELFFVPALIEKEANCMLWKQKKPEQVLMLTAFLILMLQILQNEQKFKRQKQESSGFALPLY